MFKVVRRRLLLRTVEDSLTIRMKNTMSKTEENQNSSAAHWVSVHNTLIRSEINFSLLHCIYSLTESLRFEPKVLALLCFTEIRDLC